MPATDSRTPKASTAEAGGNAHRTASLMPFSCLRYSTIMQIAFLQVLMTLRASASPCGAHGIQVGWILQLAEGRVASSVRGAHRRKYYMLALKSAFN